MVSMLLLDVKSYNDPPYSCSLKLVSADTLLILLILF